MSSKDIITFLGYCPIDEEWAYDAVLKDLCFPGDMGSIGFTKSAIIYWIMSFSNYDDDCQQQDCVNTWNQALQWYFKYLKFSGYSLTNLKGSIHVAVPERTSFIHDVQSELSYILLFQKKIRIQDWTLAERKLFFFSEEEHHGSKRYFIRDGRDKIYRESETMSVVVEELCRSFHL